MACVVWLLGLAQLGQRQAAAAAARACATAARGVRLFYSQTLETFEEGSKGTTSRRIFFSNADGKRVSPWHHIPLKVQRTPLYNFVAEIPKKCVGPPLHGNPAVVCVVLSEDLG